MYDQTINSTSIKTSVMETSIETRILKVGDLIITGVIAILTDSGLSSKVVFLASFAFHWQYRVTSSAT